MCACTTACDDVEAGYGADVSIAHMWRGVRRRRGSATRRRYMSYGLLIGRACDHFLEPYAEHVSHITGREIIAEKLGLVRMDAAGELEAAEAAQNDHDGDGVPSSAQMPPRPPHAAAGAPAGAPGARPAAVKEEEGEVAGSAVPDDGKVDTVQEAMAAAAHDAKDALAGPAA